MAHVDTWDIFRDVPHQALAGHSRRYLEDNPERTLIEGKTDAELADLLVTASTKADDDFAITRIFDYAMKFIRHEDEN